MRRIRIIALATAVIVLAVGPACSKSSSSKRRVSSAPTVTDIVPPSGLDNVATPVAITGTNFTGATGVALDDPATTALTGVSVGSGTAITASVPAGITPGVYNVRVTTPDGTNSTSAVPYRVIDSTIPAPTAIAITPSIGSNANPTPVTIDGTNFIGTVTARLDDPATTALTGVTVMSTALITATAPTGITAGTWEVRVTADGGTSPVAGVTVTAPGGSPAIYFTHPSTNDVRVHDLTTLSQLTTISVDLGPFDIAITPNGSKIYVANRGSDTVSVIDTATNAVTSTIAVGTGPQAVDFNLSGTEAYVGNVTSSDVSIIDVTTDTWIVDIPVSAGVTEVEFRRPQGDEVWVLCGGATQDGTPDPIDVIDPVTRTVTATIIDVGLSPLGITFDQGGNTAYVANAGEIMAFTPGSVEVVSVATKAVTGSVAGFNNALEIARLPGDDKAYVCNIDLFSSMVVILDTALGTTTGSIDIGGFPGGRFGFAPATSRAFIFNAAGLPPNLDYNFKTINTSTDTNGPFFNLGMSTSPPTSIVVKE
ncbi:MAG: beta-propeller fold lactonase family protein [Planctomycetota bacterium]|nr:beta-propeller fold lactonase family protein [Planctomycetota bacterium]